MAYTTDDLVIRMLWGSGRVTVCCLTDTQYVIEYNGCPLWNCPSAYRGAVLWATLTAIGALLSALLISVT